MADQCKERKMKLMERTKPSYDEEEVVVPQYEAFAKKSRKRYSSPCVRSGHKK